MLKAYRRFIYRHAKNLSQAIKHAGGSYRLNNGATLTAHLQQVEAEQGKDLQLS
ncbi:hypothetical protein ES703_74649 [subsurface metagenome]